MRRFSSLKYAPPATRGILRDRLSRYLPVALRVPAQSVPADALRDEILFDLLLNLTIVFECNVDRARTIYDAAVPRNSDEPSFDEAVAAGWMRIVWGRISTPLQVAERARAVPGPNTALAALFAKRFEEYFIFTDDARRNPQLNPYIAAIERGETVPRNLHCEDPAWVAARLWDRSLVTPSIMPQNCAFGSIAGVCWDTPPSFRTGYGARRQQLPSAKRRWRCLRLKSSLSGWGETRSELVRTDGAGQRPAARQR